MVLEASDGSLAPDGVLGAEAEEGEHREPAVLELLELRLLRLELEGVEGRLKQKGALSRLGVVLAPVVMKIKPKPI